MLAFGCPGGVHRGPAIDDPAGVGKICSECGVVLDAAPAQVPGTFEEERRALTVAGDFVGSRVGWGGVANEPSLRKLRQTELRYSLPNDARRATHLKAMITLIGPQYGLAHHDLSEEALCLARTFLDRRGGPQRMQLIQVVLCAVHDVAARHSIPLNARKMARAVLGKRPDPDPPCMTCGRTKDQHGQTHHFRAKIERPEWRFFRSLRTFHNVMGERPNTDPHLFLRRLCEGIEMDSEGWDLVRVFWQRLEEEAKVNVVLNNMPPIVRAMATVLLVAEVRNREIRKTWSAHRKEMAVLSKQIKPKPKPKPRVKGKRKPRAAGPRSLTDAANTLLGIENGQASALRQKLQKIAPAAVLVPELK